MLSVTNLSRGLVLALILTGGAAAQPARPAGPAHIAALPALDPPKDWVAGGDALAMPVRPENGAVVLQTPPDFSWPYQGRGYYQFRLQPPQGEPVERLVSTNYLLWPQELPPGAYAWQVRFWPANGSAGAWSEPRKFNVPADAWPFVMPDVEALYERAAKMPHPRTLPKGAEFERLKNELLTGSRRNRFAAFIKAVAPKLGGPMAEDVKESVTDYSDVLDRRKAEGRIVAATSEELETMIGMAFVAAITDQEEFAQDARRRLLNLASWSVHGGTGNGSFALESQTISRLMTLAYDWMYGRLTPAERIKVLDHIAARQAGLHEWYIADKPRLQIQPYDSHGYLHIGNMAAVAAVLAGEVLASKTWLMDALPLYLSLTNPWGGDDGGYGNGMNYALYDVQFSFLHWDMLRESLGIDVARKAWVRNFGLLMTYMQPPGAPAFVFGDGAGNGDDPLVSTVGRGYALRSNTGIGNWYSAQQNRSFPVPALYELIAPVPQPGVRAIGPSPDSLPNAAVFPSIGWAAMHSDLRNRTRNSVYFRSSPYGSYNHSHADQNSFVIQSKGRDLAIDSGYFYLYNAPHWTNWTKQTRAHNAITFNGGQGQKFDDRAARGKLTAFEHTAAFDYVVGDATEAYAGNLKKAKRTLAFFRPDTVVVYDSLEHYEPVKFEWNIHSKNNMVQYDGGKVGFAEGPASLCVEMHDAGRLEFIKFNEFSSPVEPPFDYLPLQWHGRFVVRQPEARTEFLAVLRISCSGPSATEVKPLAGGGYTLQLGDSRIAISEAGVRVLPPGQ